jgi:hypothetical protein
MRDVVSPWGKIVDLLWDKALIKLLKSWGIKIKITALRETIIYKKHKYVIDVIAKNEKEIIPVNVYIDLTTTDVREFIETLKIFKIAYNDYAERTVYGAVAYINVDGAADRMAENLGLFVIKATGDSAKITNTKEFVPKEWEK